MECQQGPADVNVGAVPWQVCRASGAPGVGHLPASLVLPKHPAGWHYTAASPLTLGEGKRLRAIAQGPGKPLTMQVCTMLSMQAGAGAEGIARLIREQRIYIVRKLWLAQESKA